MSWGFILWDPFNWSGIIWNSLIHTATFLERSEQLTQKLMRQLANSQKMPAWTIFEHF